MTRKSLLTLIAHAELAQGIENIKGLKGFYAHWTKTQRGDAAKILREYEKIRRQAAKDIAEGLAAEKAESETPGAEGVGSRGSREG